MAFGGLFKPDIKKMELEKDTNGLLKAVNHRDINIGGAAILALVRLGEPVAIVIIEALVRNLEAGNAIESSRAEAILTYVGEPAIKELSSAAYRSEKATRVLGLINAEPATTALIKNLYSSSKKIRYTSALALDGRRWNPESDNDLVAYYVEKQRWDACVALGNRSVPFLCRIIQESSHYDEGCRREALETLAKIGQPSVDELITVYKEKEKYASSGELLVQINYALGKIGGHKAIERLKTNLRSQAFLYSSAAASALVTAGWKPESDSDRAYLYTGLKRWDECTGLGREAILPLIHALISPNSEDTKTKLMDCLFRVIGPSDDFFITAFREIDSKAVVAYASAGCSFAKDSHLGRIIETRQMFKKRLLLDEATAIDRLCMIVSGIDTNTDRERREYKAAKQSLLELTKKRRSDMSANQRHRIAHMLMVGFNDNLRPKDETDIAIFSLVTDTLIVKKLIGYLKHPNHKARVLAARILVKLYYESDLDAETRQLIVEQKPVIEAPVEYEWYEEDMDSNNPKDIRGIGVRFERTN